MTTNELKKGVRVQLRNGWQADIADNMKGNTRMAKVYGYEVEIGSVYAWDITAFRNERGIWEPIELTTKQKKDRKRVEGFFNG